MTCVYSAIEPEWMEDESAPFIGPPIKTVYVTATVIIGDRRKPDAETYAATIHDLNAAAEHELIRIDLSGWPGDWYESGVTV